MYDEGGDFSIGRNFQEFVGNKKEEYTNTQEQRRNNV